MTYDTSFRIGNRTISGESPTYFIADIGANHDGDLQRAKDLIHLAAAAGANCAKFQHFRAASIVSREGFAGLQSAHQASWDKPVYDVYEQYSIDRGWNHPLSVACREAKIDFMTTPYDLDGAFDLWTKMNAFKIGSGDITFLSHIEALAKLQNPIFLATGASSMEEVEAAVDTVLRYNPRLCLMQCNTNYTGRWENMNYVNLRVLQTYAKRWPSLPLGLSDHTHGFTAVLGAVALGARVIEKHFTDDPNRKGPDHAFALPPMIWKVMVQRTREIESAMGDGFKKCEDNEVESRVVQRRGIYLTRDMNTASTILNNDIEFLRPAPDGCFTPAEVMKVLHKPLSAPKKKGECLFPADVVEWP